MARVTQKQKALSWEVLNCSVPVNFFQQWSFGLQVHTLNYFVMSCPALRSFTCLRFGNKFSSKITKLACKQALLLKMARGRNIGAWLLVSFPAKKLLKQSTYLLLEAKKRYRSYFIRVKIYNHTQQNKFLTGVQDQTLS